MRSLVLFLSACICVHGALPPDSASCLSESEVENFDPKLLGDAMLNGIKPNVYSATSALNLLIARTAYQEIGIVRRRSLR